MNAEITAEGKLKVDGENYACAPGAYPQCCDECEHWTEPVLIDNPYGEDYYELQICQAYILKLDTIDDKR